MVKVRLARAGSKKRPFYHIVVTDKHNPRDGRFMERLGYYDPSRPITDARVDVQRIREWIDSGAQASKRVGDLVREYRRSAEAQSA